MRGFIKVAGFVAGFIACLALEYLVLIGLKDTSGREIYPRGLGWIIIPFFAGAAGSTLAMRYAQTLQVQIRLSERDKRFGWVSTVGWLAFFNGYWVIAKPYGYRMRDDDWVTYFCILLGVPASAVVVFVAVKWAMAGSTQPTPASEPLGTMAIAPSTANPAQPTPAMVPDMSWQAFERELKAKLETAQRAGKQYLDINSGELHRVIGGYPSSNHRMPTCCAVMREFMREGDTVLYTPPLANGATFAVRYQLPR